MQGVAIKNHPNGQPAKLTIDFDKLPADASPLIEGLLARVRQESEDEERRDFFDSSGITANEAYGDDEEEYTIADCKWVNPDFNPHATR